VVQCPHPRCQGRMTKSMDACFFVSIHTFSPWCLQWSSALGNVAGRMKLCCHRSPWRKAIKDCHQRGKKWKTISSTSVCPEFLRKSGTSLALHLTPVTITNWHEVFWILPIPLLDQSRGRDAAYKGKTLLAIIFLVLMHNRSLAHAHVAALSKWRSPCHEHQLHCDWSCDKAFIWSAQIMTRQHLHLKQIMGWKTMSLNCAHPTQHKQLIDVPVVMRLRCWSNVQLQFNCRKTHISFKILYKYVKPGLFKFSPVRNAFLTTVMWGGCAVATSSLENVPMSSKRHETVTLPKFLCSRQPALTGRHVMMNPWTR